ncbi:MAG: hypothetical protein EPN60_15110 [Nevskiaceae bacterium]|jgi:hypothetical protein|nr:MAG: hypothetical protein EPN60_15110 [Nevskiaceae bacterium]
MNVLDPDLLNILQHSLGVDRYGRGQQYRNHFVAGGDDVELCRQLVALGHMTETPAGPLSGGSPCFRVTNQGRRAMSAASPAPPKLTRSQRRYERFLNADSGMPFGEWIRSKYA